MISVYKIEVRKNELSPEGEISLYWAGSDEFGQYNLIINNREDNDGLSLEIEGYSEYMDQGDDKEFLKSLFDLILNTVKVVE